MGLGNILTLFSAIAASARCAVRRDGSANRLPDAQPAKSQIQPAVPLGVDGQLARLRSILDDARDAFDAAEAGYRSAAHHLGAADYALFVLRRGLAPPAEPRLVGVSEWPTTARECVRYMPAAA